jgi:hypothetical protein
MKMSVTFFTELEKINLKFTSKHKRPQIAKVILSKRAKLEASQHQISECVTGLY